MLFRSLVARHFIEDWAGGLSISGYFPFFSGAETNHPWARALLYALFGLVLVGIGFWFERRRQSPVDT